MLIEKIIGNIANEEEHPQKATEWIELEWEELSKRILRTATDQGTDIALRIEGEEPLQYGAYYSRMSNDELQFVQNWSQLSSLHQKICMKWGKLPLNWATVILLA